MDISMILLWLSGIALVTDFSIYLFSFKYRRYGGHIIGAMAYVILLADLTYSLWLGSCGTPEFRTLLKGVLIVGGIFVFEYTVNTYKYIRQHEKGVAAHRRESIIEDELQRLRKDFDKLSERNAWLQDALNTHTEKQSRKEEAHERRIISNIAYEDTLQLMPEVELTREGFQLYALLTSGYEGEREAKFERKLHNVCEKICSSLEEDEIQALLQIDDEKTTSAGDYYDAT